MKAHPFIFPVLAACFVASPVLAKTWQDDATYKFTILHTNDNHGRFWHNKHGEYGMPARYTVINAIRQQVEAEGGSVLLLSGGDINTGVPESDLQDAEPDFIGMRKMQYDAMALGNHEFDNPLEVLAKQQKWAGFPFLSANIYAKDTDQRMFQPYSVIEKQGIKIAIIGLTTEDTAKIGNPEYLANVVFKDPKEEAKQVVAELQEEVKPDLILAVTHMGHYDDAKHGYNAPGDVALARALPNGAVTAVIGGHSQEPLCMESESLRDANYQAGQTCKPEYQNGTYIMQAHEWGKYVGRADFEFKNGKATLSSYRLIPINLKKKVKDAEGNSKRVFIGNEIAHNKEMLALLGPYLNKGKASLEVTVGHTNKLLVGERNKVRFGQTNLGRLIATAQMQKAKADFGIMNSGGIRASIETGDISYKEVLTVHPFANTLTYVSMSGKELVEYLNVVATKPTDTGAYAQFAGITMTVSPEGVSDVKIAGKALDPEQSYRFSLPSFTAAGGDGYPKITEHESFVDTGFVDADVLKEYLEKHNPLDADAFAPQGEITYKAQTTEASKQAETKPTEVVTPETSTPSSAKTVTIPRADAMAPATETSETSPSANQADDSLSVEDNTATTDTNQANKPIEPPELVKEAVSPKRLETETATTKPMADEPVAPATPTEASVETSTETHNSTSTEVLEPTKTPAPKKDLVSDSEEATPTEEKPVEEVVEPTASSQEEAGLNTDTSNKTATVEEASQVIIEADSDTAETETAKAAPVAEPAPSQAETTTEVVNPATTTSQ